MKQIKKLNYPKPPLILKEKDLLNKKLHKTKKFAVNFKADLVSVLQCMIKYEETLKINLDYFQTKTDCGTYRCVAGWWAFWLGVPIMAKNHFHTLRFRKIFCNENLFLCFEKLLYYDCNDDIIDRCEVFFGCSESKTLPERLAIAKKLKVLKILKNETN